MGLSEKVGDRWRDVGRSLAGERAEEGRGAILRKQDYREGLLAHVLREKGKVLGW